MRAIPNGRRIVPRLKRCWELFKGFICLSSLWDSNFTVISLLYQPYNSASYLCWTCRPISMTSFCLNFRNLPENDRTMRTILELHKGLEAQAVFFSVEQSTPSSRNPTDSKRL